MAKARASEGPSVAEPGPAIVLVEDEPVTRTALRRLLEGVSGGADGLGDVRRHSAEAVRKLGVRDRSEAIALVQERA
jgi:CheY-like chemotaxis protein